MLPPENRLALAIAAHAAPDHVVNPRGTKVKYYVCDDARAA
jgi:hypothetical protein